MTREGGSTIKRIKTDLYSTELHLFPECKICIETSDSSLEVYSLEDARLLETVYGFNKIIGAYHKNGKTFMVLGNNDGIYLRVCS